MEGPHSGDLEPKDKEKTDEMAIGEMRDTADTMGRRSYSSEFGRKLGDAIIGLLDEQHRHCSANSETAPLWIDLTHSTIGSTKDANLRPPPDAVKAVKGLI